MSLKKIRQLILQVTDLDVNHRSASQKGWLWIGPQFYTPTITHYYYDYLLSEPTDRLVVSLRVSSSFKSLLSAPFLEGQRQKHLPWLLILSWYWFYLLSTFGTLPLAQKISSWLLSAVMCKHAVKTVCASTSIQYFNSVVTLNDVSTLKNTECRLRVHRVQCVHKNPKKQLYLIILNRNNTKLEKQTNINDNCGSLLSVYQ